MKKFLIPGMVILAAVVAFGTLSCQDSKPAETAKKKLVFATDATWPPMEFVNDKNETVGFDIDMVRAIALAAGFDVEFKVVSWDGIFVGLENGQYDAIVSSVTISDERKLKYDFTEPYVQAGQILLVPVAAPDDLEITALAGKTVGAQISTAGAIEVQKHPEINLKEYTEVGLAIQDMVNGNLDGVVLDSPVAIDYALQNPNFKDKVKTVGQLITAEDLGMVVRKGDTATLELISKGLSAIRENGTLQTIKAAWGMK